MSTGNEPSARHWFRFAKDEFRNAQRRSDVELHALVRAGNVELGAPVAGDVIGAAEFASTYQPAPVFAATLLDAAVLPPEYFVFTRDHALVRESVARRSLGERVLSEPASLRAVASARHQKESGAVLLAGAQRVSNYFHWWLDCLARVWFADLVLGNGNLPILLPQLSAAFQNQSLLALGLDRRVRILSEGAQRYPELVFTQGLAFGAAQAVSPLVSAYALWLQDRMGLGHAPDNSPGRVLFIGRSTARWRRTTNGHEVVAALASREVRSLDLDALSVREQADYFHRAELIVAVHGAGLTNLLFARPGTRVIEVFSQRGFHDSCYRRLAHHLGMPYACVRAASSSERATDPMKDDVTIEVSHLVAVMDDMQ